MQSNKNKIHPLTLIVLLILSSIFTVFLLQFILWIAYKNNFYISFANSLYLFTKKKEFPLWMLNLIIPISLQLIMMILIRKFYTSELVYYFFIGIIAIAEFFKIKDRNEPVLPGDIYSFKTIFDSINFLPKIVIFLFIIAIILFIPLCIKIYKYDIPIFRFPFTEIIVSIIYIALSFIIFYNRPNQVINSCFNYLGDNIRYKFDATLDYSTDGMFVSYANNLIGNEFNGNKYLKKNYSKQKIDQIVSQYKKQANKINKTRKNNSFNNQTVIYILSESYTRPVNIPGLVVNGNATPNMDNILSQNTSGHMISAGYGGGTADMEYMVDTSFATSFFAPEVLTPFIQVIPKQKQVTSFAQSYFKDKIAIHPFLPNYYNRPDVFKKMGFQYFYNIKSKKPLNDLYKIENDKYYSDNSAYQNTLEKISHSSNSQYIELITMQNHMPYATNEYQHKFQILAPQQKKENDKLAQESYIQGLNYTDNSTKNFLDKLNQINRPITVLFYGDHWPSCYSFMPPQKNKFKTHLTDYFIFQNNAAKKQNGTGNVTNTVYTSPSDFSSMVLQKDNMKVTPFYAMMTKVHNQLPIICNYNLNNKNILFVDNSNNKIRMIRQNELKPKQLKLLHEYQLIQYDISEGKQYAIKDGMFKLNN